MINGSCETNRMIASVRRFDLYFSRSTLQLNHYPLSQRGVSLTEQG